MSGLVKKLIGTGLLMALIVGLLLPAVAVNAAGGLGLSPSIIDIQDVLKGTEHNTYITIMNLDSEEGSFSLSAEGDFSKWTSFFDAMASDKSPISTINIPANQSAQVGVKIKVPSDTANGEYFGTFSVQTINTSNAGASAGNNIQGGQVVNIRMQSKVRIVVTGEEILKGAVSGIGLLDIESGKPLRINVVFQNIGNVIAQPLIACKISKDAASVAEFSNTTTKVEVGGSATISTEWPTKGQPLGAYIADVSVKLGENVIATQQLTFNILPEGALTPQGNLTGLRLSKQSATSANVIAKFKNTGQMDIQAVLMAEIYRDGKKVDEIQSQESLYKPGEEKELTALANMKVSGDYVIKGLVYYNGNKTEAKEIMITVLGTNPGSEKEVAGNSPNLLYLIGGGIVILIIAAVVLLAIKKSRRTA